MDKLDFKIKVLDKARERQQEIIDDFKTSIEELKNSEMHVNEGQYDSNRQSLDVASNEMIGKLSDQLNFVLKEMNLINKIQDEIELHKSVLLGSVVKTDKRTFFTSVSIEKFVVDNQEMFGISSKAPLFKEMINKREGDSFTYKDECYRIEEVY